MADELNTYYWDACIFYEYLKGDQKSPARKAAIDAILKENKGKGNRIFTSSITHVEVLPNKISLKEEAQYWASFSSVFFFDVELDRNIISLAREIKSYYYKDSTKTESYKMMSTGDSIHLATAIIHSATQFHTRDGNRKSGNVPLLGLAKSSAHGKICGKYELEIVDPQAVDLFARQ